MTTTEPKPSTFAHHGYHATWYTNHDSEFTKHSEAEPYCSHNVAKFDAVAEGDVVTRQWRVSPTTPFNHGRLTPAELEDRARIYTGVEISLEVWRGPGTEFVDDCRIRVTSDVARSLAGALVRAADIEQGLTR